MISKGVGGCFELHQNTVHLLEPEPYSCHPSIIGEWMFEAAQSYSALIEVLPFIHAIHPYRVGGCFELHQNTVHLLEPEPLFVPSALKKD